MAKRAKQPQAINPRSRITSVERVRASDIEPHPGNWRDHPEGQAAAMAGVMREVGDVGVLLAWRSERNGGKLTLIDGHLRRGLAPDHEYMVAITDLSDAEADYVLATHDPLAAMASADAGALDALLSSVNSGEAAVQQMLAELAEGAGLYQAREEVDAEPQVDKADELREKWGTARGQVWQLGEHRLMCGDSTSAEDVARLMGGEKAALCVTSPPYWVGKEYENEKTWDEVQGFISRLSECISGATTHRIVINTGAPPAAHLTGERAHIRLLIDDYQNKLRTFGWLMRYVRIWAKRGGLAHTNPQSDCIDQHWEFIGVFYRPENYEGQRRLGEKWATDGIWDDFQGEMSSHGHVAAFPVELPSRNIRLYTDPEAIVYEPFSGSGTTLIACEQLGRKCRAMEISPAYVAVALERWAQATGKTPQLIEHGTPD